MAKQETGVCKKCGQEKPVNKFVSRRGRRGQLYANNVCMTCRGRAECARLKLEMFEALGWKCACCGIEHPYFLTLEHIGGGTTGHFYGRKDKTPAHRVQSSTYVEIRKAKRDSWDRTKWELLCINCNFADGHHGACPHRSGVTKGQVVASLLDAMVGIGKQASIDSMIEGGKGSRFTGGPGPRRPEMKGNTFAAQLTEEQVKQIKLLRDTGMTQQQVANDFGIGRQQVGMIWSGKRWGRVEVS
jgi:hypothetical protein